MDKHAARREAEYLAAKSKKINSLDMTLGFLRVKGRPHLLIGGRALLRHPVALVLALIQCSIVPVLLHDAMIILHLSKFLSVFGTDFSSTRLWIPPLEIHPIYTIAIAMFVINVFWAVMASEISGKALTLRSLLSGLMGWLPMPAMKSLILPHWLQSKINNGSKEAIWGEARLSQAVAAFWLGTDYSKAQTDLALARSLDKHGDEIVDGLSSYVMYPVILIIFIFITFALYYSTRSVSEVSQTIGQPVFLLPFTLGDMILPYVAWMSYNRAALYAMIMHFMASESVSAPIKVEWECRKITWHYWLAVTIEIAIIMGFFAAILSRVLNQALTF